MAYLGEAMTHNHPVCMKQDVEATRAVLARLAELHERYPDDVDATAFCGLLILGAAHGGRNVLTYVRAAGVLEEAWMAHSEHPGHSMDPDNSLTGSFANMRLRYLPDTGDWGGEVAGWSLPETAGPGARLDFAFARAKGCVSGHDAGRHISAKSRPRHKVR